MPTAIVTGANRGIGLEHVSRFAARGWRVFAFARDPSAADDLNRLASDKVTIHPYDAADPDAPAKVKEMLAGAPVDILLCNAGVGSGPLSVETMVDRFKVNAVAPLFLALGLADNVAASEKKLIAMQSSVMGSIAETSGGSYAYRASKAALNMLAKALSGDLASRGIIVVTLHPGWVKTRMGGGSAPVEVEDSVAGEQALFDRLTAADSGKFYAYDGREIPW